MYMKKAWLYTIALIAVFGLILTGCEKSNNPLTNDLEGPDTHTVGCPLFAPLYIGQDNLIGGVYVWNDASNIYVKYEINSNNDLYLDQTHLWIGENLSGLPVSGGGNPNPGQFPFKHDPIEPLSKTDLYSIPLVGTYPAGELAGESYEWILDEELFIVAHCAVVESLPGEPRSEDSETGFAGDHPGPTGSRWWYYFHYIVQGEQQEEDGQFRTQTQGGWGAPPHGNNPGMYLHNNFDDAFGDDLVVGIGYHLTFTCAQAITDFLPQGGKPVPLPGNLEDPTDKVSVFWGQVVALKLNVEFDLYDPDFGESEGNLQYLTVADESSPFYGVSVGMVLLEAEKVLGGTYSEYSINELNECVSQINENYVDGVVDNGFLE